MDIEKPLELDIDEAEKEILEAINATMANHRLNCTAMAMIMAGVYRQILDGKKEELERARSRFYGKKEKKEVEESGN